MTRELIFALGAAFVLSSIMVLGDALSTDSSALEPESLSREAGVVQAPDDSSTPSKAGNLFLKTIDENGDPLEGVILQIWPSTTAYGALYRKWEPPTAGKSDGRGEVDLVSEPDEIVRVTALCSERQLFAETRLSPRALDGRRFELILRPDLAITGRLCDHAGRTLPNHWIFLSEVLTWPEGRDYPVALTSTDEGGSFRFEVSSLWEDFHSSSGWRERLAGWTTPTHLALITTVALAGQRAHLRTLARPLEAGDLGDVRLPETGTIRFRAHPDDRRRYGHGAWPEISITHHTARFRRALPMYHRSAEFNSATGLSTSLVASLDDEFEVWVRHHNGATVSIHFTNCRGPQEPGEEVTVDLPPMGFTRWFRGRVLLPDGSPASQAVLSPSYFQFFASPFAPPITCDDEGFFRGRIDHGVSLIVDNHPLKDQLLSPGAGEFFDEERDPRPIEVLLPTPSGQSRRGTLEVDGKAIKRANFDDVDLGTLVLRLREIEQAQGTDASEPGFDVQLILPPHCDPTWFDVYGGLDIPETRRPEQPARPRHKAKRLKGGRFHFGQRRTALEVVQVRIEAPFMPRPVVIFHESLQSDDEVIQRIDLRDHIDMVRLAPRDPQGREQLSVLRASGSEDKFALPGWLPKQSLTRPFFITCPGYRLLEFPAKAHPDSLTLEPAASITITAAFAEDDQPRLPPTGMFAVRDDPRWGFLRQVLPIEDGVAQFRPLYPGTWTLVVDPPNGPGETDEMIIGQVANLDEVIDQLEGIPKLSAEEDDARRRREARRHAGRERTALIEVDPAHTPKGQRLLFR
jgi:hypothetical protein